MLLSFFQSSIFLGLLTGLGTIFSFSVAGFIAFKYLFLYGLRLASFSFLGLAAGEVTFLTFIFFTNPATVESWLYFVPFISVIGFFLSLNSLLQRFQSKPSPFTSFLECFILVLANPVILFNNARFFSFNEFHTTQDFVLFFLGLFFSIILLGLISSFLFSFGSNQLFYSIFSKVEWTKLPLFKTKRQVTLIQYQETLIKLLSSFGVAIVTWSFFQHSLTIYPKYYFGEKSPRPYRIRTRVPLKKFNFLKTARLRRQSPAEREERNNRIKILSPMFSPIVYNAYSNHNREDLQHLAQSNVRLAEPLWKNGSVRYLTLFPKEDQRSDAEKRMLRIEDSRKVQQNQVSRFSSKELEQADSTYSLPFDQKMLRASDPNSLIYSADKKELFFNKHSYLRLKERLNPALITQEPTLLNLTKQVSEAGSKRLLNKVNYYKNQLQAEALFDIAEEKPAGTLVFPFGPYFLQVYERFPYSTTLNLQSIPKPTVDAMLGTNLAVNDTAQVVARQTDFVKASVALFATDPEAFHFFLFLRDNDISPFSGGFEAYIKSQPQHKDPKLVENGYLLLQKSLPDKLTGSNFGSYLSENYDYNAGRSLKARSIVNNQFVEKCRTFFAKYPELAYILLAP